MIPCSLCSTDNTDDSFYCKRCGALLERTDGAVPEDMTTTLATPIGRVPPGTVLADRYRVGTLLGQGGMGVVYRAERVDSGEAVAVKFLRASAPGAGRGSAIQRFQREIEIAKRLDHPHLVKLLDSGRWEESSFLVMEHVDGDSLKQKIALGETRKLAVTLPLLRQICEGLDAAHQAGVVHRDVKPSNVLLTKDGEVKVCDFGLAYTEGQSLTRLTQTGASMGTPEYMAPEQIEGHRVDSRADIYSLGVLMYEAVTEQLPFVGENATAILMQHLNRAPLPPSTVNASLPVWLERIIVRAMEKEPSRRFQSVQEIRAQLEPSAGGRRSEIHPLTGDKIVFEETPDGVRLTIHARHERVDWTSSAAVRFDERFYKVARSSVSGTSTHPFVYVLEVWPEAEVLRRIVDYEDSASPARQRKWGGIKKLFNRSE